MTNPDQTTGKYAELRTRAENIRDDIEVAQTREVSTFLEDACDAVIRDLLAALAETQAELGRSREALNEMQGVVERIATGDNECLTRGDFEELAQAALARDLQDRPARNSSGDSQGEGE